MSSSNYFILLLAGLFFVGIFGDQQQDSSVMTDSISLPKDSLGLKDNPLASVEQQQNEDEMPAVAAKEDNGVPEAQIAEDGQHEDEAVQKEGKAEEEEGRKMMEEEGKKMDEKKDEKVGEEEKKKESGQEEVAKPEGDGTKTEEAQKGTENKEQKGALNWLSKLYCMIFGLGGWGCPTTDKKATEEGVVKQSGGMPHKGKRRMIAVGWEENEDGEAGFGAGMASIEQEMEEEEKKGEEPKKKDEGVEEKEEDTKKVNEMEGVEDDKTGTEVEGTLTLN